MSTQTFVCDVCGRKLPVEAAYVHGKLCRSNQDEYNETEANEELIMEAFESSCVRGRKLSRSRTLEQAGLVTVAEIEGAFDKEEKMARHLYNTPHSHDHGHENYFTNKFENREQQSRGERRRRSSGGKRTPKNKLSIGELVSELKDRGVDSTLPTRLKRGDFSSSSSVCGGKLRQSPSQSSVSSKHGSTYLNTNLDTTTNEQFIFNTTTSHVHRGVLPPVYTPPAKETGNL
eukprot:m.13235 g.13235  ORF g.13235 m.13235 type:complete len:231 (-) comp7475_c0_seq1:242-934(-)